MKQIIVTAALALLVIAGCGKKTEYKIPTTETLNKNTGNEIIFTERKLSKSINNCRPGDSNCSYIRLNYVEAVNGSGKDKINGLINKMLLTAYEPDKNHADPQQMIALFEKNNAEFAKQNPNKPWMLDFIAREFSQTDKLVSLIIENVSYFGAPPPKIMTYYKNFYKSTGDTVKLEELLGEGFEKKLNLEIEKNYREWRKLSPSDDLQEKGNLFQKTMKYTNNFAITKEKGMDFYYQTGEIMPASFGPIIIKLPPNVVQGFIYGDNPLR